MIAPYIYIHEEYFSMGALDVHCVYRACRDTSVYVHTEIMESKWSGLDTGHDTALNLNKEHIEMAI